MDEQEEAEEEERWMEGFLRGRVCSDREDESAGKQERGRASIRRWKRERERECGGERLKQTSNSSVSGQVAAPNLRPLTDGPFSPPRLTWAPLCPWAMMVHSQISV